MRSLTFDGINNTIQIVDDCGDTHTYVKVTSEDNVEFWKKQIAEARLEIAEWHEKDTHWKAEINRLTCKYEIACNEVAELKEEMARAERGYGIVNDELECLKKKYWRLVTGVRTIKDVLKEDDA